MATPQPGIGDWYRLNGGSLFEVVALDDDDGTIEIQYFDGTVEEMDIEDWDAQWNDGALEAAEAPEDWSGSVDVEAPMKTAAAPARIPWAMTATSAPARSTASTCSTSPRPGSGSAPTSTLSASSHEATLDLELPPASVSAPRTGPATQNPVDFSNSAPCEEHRMQRAVGGEKAFRQQIQRVAGVRAAIDVAAHLRAGAHHAVRAAASHRARW